MSLTEEKAGECVVSCHRCGKTLMKSASATLHMVCPYCGAHLVVCVKSSKVTVFDDMKSENEIAEKRKTRLSGYAGCNKK